MSLGNAKTIGKRGGALPVTLTTVTLMLAGCASFSEDGGMALVAEKTGSILGKDAVKIKTPEDAAWADARVAELLAQPMSVDAAVQVALLNNRALQASYNELGVSEAEMIEASLPPAPAVSLSRLVGSGFEIERAVAQNILALLTLPRRREIAEDRFRAAQAQAVQQTLATAADARRSYFRAVAASQTVLFLEEARTAADATSELAKKLGETGAMPKLDQAREHAFYAEVSGELGLARLRQRTEREKLNRAMGLWGNNLAYRLPSKLKALPGKPYGEVDIETRAVTTRVDLEITRMNLAIMAKEYGLTRATRLINVLEVSGRSTRERTKTTDVSYALNPGPPPTLNRTQTPAIERLDRNGIDVTFEIPIYDFGEARTRLAEETYLKAVNHLVDLAVNVRADARESYQSYRGSYDIARHYEKEILPLREIISEQTLLNYNGMLSDLFGLLTDARARIAANVKAIEAKRDFWLATVDLQTAVQGGGVAGADTGQSVASAGAAGD